MCLHALRLRYKPHPRHAAAHSPLPDQSVHRPPMHHWFNALAPGRPRRPRSLGGTGLVPEGAGGSEADVEHAPLERRVRHDGPGLALLLLEGLVGDHGDAAAHGNARAGQAGHGQERETDVHLGVHDAEVLVRCEGERVADARAWNERRNA